MRSRQIGSLEVSVVGLGCNNFGRRLDAHQTERVVHAALDAGITFFDTADSYGGSQSETFLGRALKGRRSEAVVATKFGSKLDQWRHGAAPTYVRRAVEDSLRRLDTDVIDLYQLHRPDPSVPIEDTLGALDALVREGLVREIGCSNFDVDLLERSDAAASGQARFVSVQNHYSLFHREPEEGVLPACERLGIAFIPYFPLANGLLTGKYRKGEPLPEGTRLVGSERETTLLTDANLERVEALVAFAAAAGRSLLELAFSWLLTRPVVASVIAGGSSVEQVMANAGAADWQLNADDLAAIDALL